MAVELNEATIEELKARTDLGELIASYGVSLRRSGSGVTACCPFHNEKTPSFHVNVSKGFYHCFGCGESGDAIKFVQKYEGLSFMDAVKKLAAMCGMEIKSRENPEAGRSKRLYALMADLAAFYHRCLAKTKEAATPKAEEAEVVEVKMLPAPKPEEPANDAKPAKKSGKGKGGKGDKSKKNGKKKGGAK